MTNIEREICQTILNHIEENHYHLPIYDFARFKTIIKYDTTKFPEEELRYDLRMGGGIPCERELFS